MREVVKEKDKYVIKNVKNVKKDEKKKQQSKPVPKKKGAY